MAAIDHSAYARDFASPFAGITSSFANAKRALRTHIAYRQTLTSLGKLSSRQLDDIGLDAGTIHVVAREMAARHTF